MQDNKAGGMKANIPGEFPSRPTIGALGAVPAEAGIFTKRCVGSASN